MVYGLWFRVHGQENARDACRVQGGGEHVRVMNTPVVRIWHTYDSQGRILAWDSRSKSLKRFKVFSLGSEAAVADLISHTVFISHLAKVNSQTKSSTYSSYQD